MCFAPHRHALFRHLNFQKCCEPISFWHFWLRNVLRATTACTFSTSQLPKVLRARQLLTLLTSKCASRHNGVQFFISHLASWLGTRRFSEPTFRPSGATNHWKNTVFCDFPTFSRICIFFLLTLSLLRFSLLIVLLSLPLPYSAFHLSILSEVWLLNFLRQLQLHSTTTTTTTALHHTASSSCGKVTTATIATIPKKTTPTTCRSISGFAYSLCHPWFTTTNLSYRFPMFETSATALCGTTGTAMESCGDASIELFPRARPPDTTEPYL